MVKAKICGITSKEAADAAVKGGAAYAGFVFFPRSPRHLSPEQAKDFSQDIPELVKTVAVVVNPTDDVLREVQRLFTPDYWQLHGKETPERVSEIKDKTGIPVIKALAVHSGDDVALSNSYMDIADMLLFDAKGTEELPGGNGLPFDWSLLKDRDFSLPWMLSGGLNIYNAAEAIAKTGAEIVDVSSSLEHEPGQKDPALIKQFLGVVSSL